jgi:hypothetical protein
MSINYDDIDDVRAELMAEDRLERQRRNRLIAHPDPRDPDYPHEHEQEDEE